MDLLRTTRTYATREAALRFLMLKMGPNMEGARYLIAVNEEGRFAPVLVGSQYMMYAQVGVTVVG